MDHIWGIFKDAIGEIVAELLGEAVGLGIVALLMLVGVFPIYLLLKKFSGSKTTFAEDVQESFRMRSQPRHDAVRMLSTLDSVESIVLQVYKCLLLFALVAGTVFMVWLFIAAQSDSQRTILRLYLGAGYLFLLFWVGGSFAMIKRRETRKSVKPTAFGGMNFQIQQSADTTVLDETTMQAARMYVAGGESIESVCDYINPKYRRWHPRQRQAFEMAVKAALAERQEISDVPNSGGIASASYSGLETGRSKNAHAAAVLTPRQIVIVVAVFLFGVSAFSVILVLVKGFPHGQVR